MSRSEKKAYMLRKVGTCITGKTSAGYVKFNWTIGIFPGSVMQGVCRKCFCHVYCIGHTYVDLVVAKLKVGQVNADPALRDGRLMPSNAFTKNITDLAACFGIELSPLQLAALVVPNTVASLTCFAWMQSYFEAVGDKQPNHQEIHLEPISIKEVHSEYYQVHI